VLGIREADHEESAPEASVRVITRLACSLVGQPEGIRLEPGSLARSLYGSEETVEEYRCSFGLNPDYQDRLLDGEFVCSGSGPDGAVRIAELRSHRFFLATLFLPQLRSSEGSPHPLFVGYLTAALGART
jgi:CTP synthase (UTP-ammonia lyase)